MAEQLEDRWLSSLRIGGCMSIRGIGGEAKLVRRE
jgi:hypothetical protein